MKLFRITTCILFAIAESQNNVFYRAPSRSPKIQWKDRTGAKDEIIKKEKSSLKKYSSTMNRDVTKDNLGLKYFPESKENYDSKENFNLSDFDDSNLAPAPRTRNRPKKEDHSDLEGKSQSNGRPKSEGRPNSEGRPGDKSKDKSEPKDKSDPKEKSDAKDNFESNKSESIDHSDSEDRFDTTTMLTTHWTSASTTVSTVKSNSNDHSDLMKLNNPDAPSKLNDLSNLRDKCQFALNKIECMNKLVSNNDFDSQLPSKEKIASNPQSNLKDEFDLKKTSTNSDPSATTSNGINPIILCQSFLFFSLAFLQVI